MKEWKFLNFIIAAILFFLPFQGAAFAEEVAPNENSEFFEPRFAPPDKVWHVSFNQPIDPESITSDSVYVLDEAGVKVAIEVERIEDGTVLQISPKELYVEDKTYQLVVTTKVKSNHSQLQKPVMMPFTVSEWNAPKKVIFDDLGQSYDVYGLEETLENIKISRPSAEVKDSFIDEKDEFQPIEEQPVRIDLPEDGNSALIQMKMAEDEKPDMLLNLDEEEQVVELVPFIYDEETGEIEVQLKESAVLLPVKVDEQSDLFSAQAADEFERSFIIEKNENGRVVIKLDFNDRKADDYPYYYTVEYNGSLFLSKREIGDDMKIDVYLFENVVPAGGAYMFKIYRDDAGKDTLVWSQNVFVEPKSSLSYEEQKILAEKYAPILAYHQDEKYYPIALEDIFHSKEVNKKIQVKIATLKSGKKFSLEKLGEFMPSNGHSNYYINFGFKNFSFNKITGSEDSATIYYSFIERDRWIYLNYHTFYGYDPKTGTSGIASHNLDRESVTVVLNKEEVLKNFKTNANGRFAEEVDSVVYGAHMEGQLMKLVDKNGGSVNNDKVLQKWKTGRVRVTAEELVDNDHLLVGTHPIIAVAKGAHAVYPIHGYYEVTLSKFNEPAGIVKNFNPKKDRLNRILIPDFMPHDKGLKDYHLQPLHLGHVTSDETFKSDIDQFPTFNGYLAFSGSWVDVLGGDNAAFPPFTNREKLPVNWVSGASDWSFAQGKIPKLSLEISENVNKYIDRHLGVIEEGNLLKSPNGEYGDMSGWVDPDDAWVAVNDGRYGASNISPHGGDYFIWPGRKDLKHTFVYQDVDVSDLMPATSSEAAVVHLSGWLSNWHQSPPDRASLVLEALDEDGNVLAAWVTEQEEAVWKEHRIDEPLPEETHTLRVYLKATRFSGSNNDAYFDDLKLTVETMPKSYQYHFTMNDILGNKFDGHILSLDRKKVYVPGTVAIFDGYEGHYYAALEIDGREVKQDVLLFGDTDFGTFNEDSFKGLDVIKTSFNNQPDFLVVNQFNTGRDNKSTFFMIEDNKLLPVKFQLKDGTVQDELYTYAYNDEILKQIGSNEYLQTYDIIYNNSRIETYWKFDDSMNRFVFDREVEKELSW